MSEVMVGVTEHGEGMEVQLDYRAGKPVIVALNECGYNSTEVDLIQVLEWAHKNMPEVYAAQAVFDVSAPMLKKQWVGLTDEDIKDIVGRNDPGGIGRYTRDLFKKIEDKLKEKNGG